MSEKTLRISKVSRELNVGTSTIIDFLATKGHKVDNSPNAKITMEQFDLLQKEFETSRAAKEEASGMTIGSKAKVEGEDASSSRSDKSEPEDQILIKNVGVSGKKENSQSEDVIRAKASVQGTRVLGKIDLDKKKTEKAEEKVKEEAKEEVKKEIPKEEPKAEPKKVEEKPEAKEEVKPEEKPVEEEKKKEEPKAEEKKPEPETVAKEEAKTEAPKVKEQVEEPGKTISAKADKLQGLKVLGKIELPKKPEKKGPEKVASSDDSHKDKDGKRKRKRIRTGSDNRKKPKEVAGKKSQKEEVSDKEIQEQIKATMAKISGGSKSPTGVRAKYRKEKRSAMAQAREDAAEQEDTKTLKVTEFVSANDLASLMDVNVNDVISTCLSLGMFVSINQRLDAESITIIADEFDYNVEFVSSEQESEEDLTEQDHDENMIERAPIVTIMGHVDHGKTSLLDYIRSAKVTEGEAGGITQHIGAYDVVTESGKRIVFLDTPGHEAFTAMRARGAAVTDVAIIVIAADDSVMPQTKEAINHASNAGVPIVFALNKMDKPNANPDKVKEELANMNYMVEDWGGKYQCEQISAKTGQGVEELLEKVLLEAELLELKADSKKRGNGTVIEAELDKGRGYVATLLNESGIMKVGDVILAGSHMGKVKAMFDHRGIKMKEVGPATPALVLGLNGAPQAGDKFNIMESEREAREIANNRAQIQREQSIRTKKHITLDEIGRRLAIGSFKELNVIVKGDVDGSVEALADSLLKLSTDEIKVSIIHKGVGQISESDVLLASASDAVILGFQVRPSGTARKLAENEEIEIRHYSIIYDAINEIKDAMEGMLEPTKEEVVIGTVEIRQTFKISKVGTIAGCFVKDGLVKRKSQVRVLRDGIVLADTTIDELKRHKDDVTEVKFGYECGIRLKSFNDIEEGDELEVYEEREIKRKL
ncbi:MAG: translation initiation factor IF-2 [Cytophagales bacterium]